MDWRREKVKGEWKEKGEGRRRGEVEEEGKYIWISR